MSAFHGWVQLPLIDGLSAHVRADQVVAIAPAEAFPDLCGPGAAGGSVVSVGGNMLLRSSESVQDVVLLVRGLTG